MIEFKKILPDLVVVGLVVFGLVMVGRIQTPIPIYPFEKINWDWILGLEGQDEINANTGVAILPHDALSHKELTVFYRGLAVANPEIENVVVISPNHFETGTANIQTDTRQFQTADGKLTPSRQLVQQLLISGLGKIENSTFEKEHGITMQAEYIKRFFPESKFLPIVLKANTTPAEVDALVLWLTNNLPTENTLVLGSIDFSHYLPGQVAYVHDLLAVDIIEARSIDEAKKIEADSPASIEVLLRLAKLKSLNIEVLRNTNPSLDADVETFENTTHLFACSSDVTARERQLKTSMFFVHPREWYLGKTREDRYLFGYDETYFDQELAKDTAVITYSTGEEEFIEFDYFTP